jgi:hypothetical protein
MTFLQVLLSKNHHQIQVLAFLIDRDALKFARNQSNITSLFHSPLSALSLPKATKCLTAEDMVEVVVAAAAEEDTPTGTIITAVETTTPVDIPTGMKTLGLDIVVKSVAFRSF